MNLLRDENVLTKLEHVALNETKSLLRLLAENKMDNSRIVEILALLIIQTSCCEQKETSLASRPLSAASDFLTIKCELNASPTKMSKKERKKERKKEMKSDGFVQSKPCFMDERFYPLCRDTFKLFAKLSCQKAVIQSKSNYGSPMVRFVHGAPQVAVAGGKDRKPSKFLWKLAETVATEVPDKYSKWCECALLFLAVSDSSSSFLTFLESNGDSIAAMDLPCLIKMFGSSNTNNQHNLPAFMSEYIALLHVGMFCKFVGDEFTCESEKETFDFSISKTGKKICRFSVKRINESTKYFGDLYATASLQSMYDFVFEFDENKVTAALSELEVTNVENTMDSTESERVNQANIYLYQCDCDQCLKQPVQRVEVSDEVPEFKSDCTCAEKIEDTLLTISGEIFKQSSEKKVIIYLVRSPLSNDIQFAMDKKAFRDRYFPIKDFLVCSLKDNFRDEAGKLPEGFGGENSQPISMLIDRSSN